MLLQSNAATMHGLRIDDAREISMAAIRSGLHRKQLMKLDTTSDPTQAAIAAFLDAHYAHAHVNDVGPLLGRLASLRESPRDDAVEPQLWNAAVSAALTGEAPPVRR